MLDTMGKPVISVLMKYNDLDRDQTIILISIWCKFCIIHIAIVALCTFLLCWQRWNSQMFFLNCYKLFLVIVLMIKTVIKCRLGPSSYLTHYPRVLRWTNSLWSTKWLQHRSNETWVLLPVFSRYVSGTFAWGVRFDHTHLPSKMDLFCSPFWGKMESILHSAWQENGQMEAKWTFQF